ncbi:MAG: asparaginase [Actinomycetota bacterium]|nr:asparaginase [Actinomycetota bacterium]
MSQPLVEVVRGPLVEAVHQGDLAVVDASGRLLASVGDPQSKVAYWRSSAKPFQSMPLVYGGAARRWGLTPEDLALCCGSHNGEPVHTDRVAALLERLGLTAEDLACGAHPPLNGEAAAALLHADMAPTALHNNCSGLHAGMLATARHLEAPVEGYESPGHPVQQEILANVCRFTGLRREEVLIGVDGCAAPCYGLSIYHMALAYARLMEPRGLPDAGADASGTIRDSMMAHPHLVAGRGRLDTDLMRVGRGALVAKGGASGVQCVAIAGGLGLALKVEDGAGGPPSPGRPTSVATVEALRQLRVLDEAQAAQLDDHARPAIVTFSGRHVGEVRPAFRLG